MITLKTKRFRLRIKIIEMPKPLRGSSSSVVCIEKKANVVVILGSPRNPPRHVKHVSYIVHIFSIREKYNYKITTNTGLL